MPLPALLAICLALLLTACSEEDQGAERVASTAPVVQLGAPGEQNRTLDPDEAAELDLTVEHTEADVTFVRHMLRHHEQAILMTDLVDDRTDDESVRLLAERMSISQDAEIEQMEEWLINRGETVFAPGAQSHSDHGPDDMPGMLTPEQLDRLEAAEGEEFSRLFLELMIQHHEGALTMVEELWASEGGQEVQIGDLARHIESDQRIELSRMRGLLEQLG